MQIGQGRWLGKSLRIVNWLLLFGSVLAGSLAKANPAYFPSSWAPAIAFIQFGWSIPLLLVLAPISTWAVQKFDTIRHLESVHDLLDQLCDRTFRNSDFEHEQNRRVTLFKHARFTFRRWPFFGGWLIPIERSGTMTRNTQAIFIAPDDGEKCEGVGGRAWSKKKSIYVSGLPNLRSKTATDADFATYAERSFCSEERLRKGRPPQSRSLLGIPVEVRNKPWGVVVIDCTKEGLPENIAKSTFALLAPTLSSTLKGV